MCTELVYYFGVGAEVLCICLHTRSDREPQARYLKQDVISDKMSANALSLRHSNASTDPPRQRRYGFVIACARRLRNVHLNLCGGAPGVSVLCTRSSKSYRNSKIIFVPHQYLVGILERIRFTLVPCEVLEPFGYLSAP